MGICQIPSLQWIDIQWSNDISEPLTSCPPGQNLITNASHRQNVTWAVATNNLKPQPKKKTTTCRWEVVAGSGISIYVYNIITHIHLVYSPVTILVGLQRFFIPMFYCPNTKTRTSQSHLASDRSVASNWPEGDGVFHWICIYTHERIAYIYIQYIVLIYIYIYKVYIVYTYYICIYCIVQIS